MGRRSLKPVRPVETRDLDGINTLLATAGRLKRTRRGFDWLLRDNPGQNGAPAGWVVEDREGRIAAFIGNFVQRAWLSGRSCLTASSHSFIAAQGQPARALRLVRPFVNQDDAALLNGLMFDPVSARIFETLGYPSLPETGNLRIAWPIGSSTISDPLRSAARQVLAALLPEMRPPVPAVGDAIAASGEDLEQIVAPYASQRLADFDAELRSGPRLFAERSPEALQWRLSDPDAIIPPILLAYPTSGAVRGIALFRFRRPGRRSPLCLDVVDLVTLDPRDRAAATALLRGGLKIAEEGGALQMRLDLVTAPLLTLIGPLLDGAGKTASDSSHAFYRFNIDLPEPVTKHWQPLPFDVHPGSAG